jgi:hypothetical protein
LPGENRGTVGRIGEVGLGPRSVCARLYVVRPHQVFGAETAFAETARFIKVSALIR